MARAATHAQAFETAFEMTVNPVPLAGCTFAGKEGDEALCELIRHIFGNPFCPDPALSWWPALVVKLAEALYLGEDCSFALHDALLEGGHAVLAEHFQERDHPKGCWAVDLLMLGGWA
jgi:hypothetical protein